MNIFSQLPPGATDMSHLIEKITEEGLPHTNPDSQKIAGEHALNTQRIINAEQQREINAALLRTTTHTDHTGLPNPPLSNI
ncbi:MAG: hypothetical protein ACOYK1_08160 [Vampirovibrionia bacterium]